MLDIDNLDNQNLFPFNKGYDRFCHSWVATAIVGSGIIGAATTAYSANRAARAQTAAANKAADIATNQYNTTRSDLAPFRQTGVDASTELNNRLPFLTSPIVMDQEALENTPGYQFNLRQGQRAVQNAAAARGLGVSGAVLKGAASFATRLADNTYQTQFNLENTNRTNAFNRLKSLVDTGENAAAQTGTFGANAANTAAQANVGAGNAQAAAANAIGSSVGNLSNNVAGYAMYKGIYGNNRGSGDQFRTDLPNPNGGGFAVGY